MEKFIAVDLGSESGRVMIGRIDDNQLSLDEVHRFPNHAVNVLGHQYRNPLGMFQEIKQGIFKAAQQFGGDFISAGVNCFGLDYALLDSQGDLVGTPYCYRDSRTEGVMERVFERIPPYSIYQQSAGILLMPINTLYQLVSMVESNSPQLEKAAAFLMLPDLINYWLTGRKANEFTDATTTQCYNALEGDWSWKMMQDLGIPTHIFQEVIHPGTEIGLLLPDIAEELGIKPFSIVAPASHDTASATVAIPAETSDYAWLSSGTWSLFGGVSDKPLVSAEALAYNFSSYGGVAKMFFPWKNMWGLWLVQECRRIWMREGDTYSYDDLTQLAAGAKPFTAIIEPDDLSFLSPENMPEAIQTFCRRSSQAIPQTRGEIIRTILEGLALKYRWTFEKLQVVLGRELHRIHIVGGGSKNRLLCQFTADVTQEPVIAGPVEATSIGNILVQAVAKGYLSSYAEAKELVRRSFNLVEYEPGSRAGWDEAYIKFKTFLEK